MAILLRRSVSTNYPVRHVGPPPRGVPWATTPSGIGQRTRYCSWALALVPPGVLPFFLLIPRIVSRVSVDPDSRTSPVWAGGFVEVFGLAERHLLESIAHPSSGSVGGARVAGFKR